MKNTITTINKKVIINLEGIAPTQSAKIGALRFGNRNNCFEYLNSTSLSPLNEKSIAFLLSKVDEGFNKFEFSSNTNCIRLVITHFSICCGIATIKADAELINCAHLWADKFVRIANNHTTAKIEIKYTLPLSEKEQKTLPQKYMGTIKLFKYDKPIKEYPAYPYTLTIKEF